MLHESQGRRRRRTPTLPLTVRSALGNAARHSGERLPTRTEEVTWAVPETSPSHRSTVQNRSFAGRPGLARRRPGQAGCTTRVRNQRRAEGLSGVCGTLRPMNKIGYARVSTRDQQPQAQLDALQRAGCARVFVDHGASGRLARRPELDRALDYLRPGDQLVITKLDRIGRSVRHLIELAGQLAARDVDLVVLHQAIDTTTPGGRLFFHLLAAFAEFEADLASERTRDGLEAARARGRAGGRRPKLNPRQLALARQLYDSREHSVQAIAETLGVARSTIYRALSSRRPCRRGRRNQQGAVPVNESLSEWQVQFEEDLNATADQDLGTAVAVCDGEGRYDDGSLLEVCELRHDVDSDSWTPQLVAASVLVDPLLFNAVTDQAIETLHTTLQRLYPDILVSVRVAPKRVPPGWRQGRIEARLSDVGPNNQATYRTLPDDHPRKDGLKFHNVGELRMYEALVRAQQRRPQEATIGILPGAGFRTSQRTFWPDFVITHRGRVGVIEVDGPQHRNRAAADQSRDRQLQDAGVTLTERIMVEDLDQRAELDAFVERVLARLLTR